MNTIFFDYFELEGEKLQMNHDCLHNQNKKIKVPVINGIPRFTPDDSYSTGNFSKLRDEFATLQMDSKNGTDIRLKTILKRTNWPKNFFKGKTVLECGTGAGPDAEILLKLGAKVMAVDIAGLDVAKKNLGNNPNLQLVQASINNLPLKKKSFDIVFCHRVLQHTPDPQKTLDHILQFVKDDGAVFVHSYSRSFKQMCRWKYPLRIITKHMDSERLFRIIKAYSRPAFRITKFLNSFFIGRVFAWFFIPFLNYRYIPLFADKSDEYMLEYGIHDTFDALAPRYDNPIGLARMGKGAKKRLKKPFEAIEKYGATFLRSIVSHKSEDKNKTYFIKEGYISNKERQTMDAISQKKYWEKKIIYSAGFHQFYVYKYAASLAQSKGLKSIIDVGCGVGTKLAYVHNHVPSIKIIGIDQKSAIEYCKANYNFGTWYSDDFENPRTDLQDEKADLVICSDVIEHVLDPDKLLLYIKKKMTDKSLLILSTPERDILWGKECNFSPNKHHIREWNYRELKAYLLDRGFIIIDHHFEHPIKIGLNRIFISHLIRWAKNNLFKGLSLKSNQVLLLKKK